MKSPAKYDAHMNDLMRKVSAVFEGEDAGDALKIAAVACAWAVYLGETNSERRRKVLEGITEFMRNELEKIESHEGRGDLWTQ